MKMADVKVGMRLRSTLNSFEPEVTVTEITQRGFTYRYDAPRPYIPRWGMLFAAEGHEHFGSNGEAFYEPVT